MAKLVQQCAYCGTKHTLETNLCTQCGSNELIDLHPDPVFKEFVPERMIFPRDIDTQMSSYSDANPYPAWATRSRLAWEERERRLDDLQEMLTKRWANASASQNTTGHTVEPAPSPD